MIANTYRLRIQAYDFVAVRTSVISFLLHDNQSWSRN